MSLVLLPDRLVEKLVHLPESGMGYQLVDLVMRNKRVIKKVTVLNSMYIETAQLRRGINVKDVVDVKLHSEHLVK